MSEILSDSDARLCKTGGNARCGQLWRSHSRQVIPTGTVIHNVELKPGQTLAIGGLMDNTMLSEVDKIPILGDIPLLGLLFRSEFEETTKTELLIVLTPHVITSPAEEARVKFLTEREIDLVCQTLSVMMTRATFSGLYSAGS